MSAKKKSASAPVRTPAKKIEDKSTLWHWLLPLLATAAVFAGVTELGWTNWDDDVYVLDNPLIGNPDFKRIFTGPVAGTYNPLVILSWAAEWHFAQDSPMLYHINNLLLHLGCTGLVFFILKKLGLSPLWAAMGMLLFGIHPMRVESVAWITERKDLLYGIFYLAAISFYLSYQDKKKTIFLLLSFLLFALSLLSKIQAVTLPPLLLLIDWYRGRTFSLKTISEKIPFFLAALATGLLGIFYLKEGNIVDLEGHTHTLSEKIVFGLSAYTQYLAKFLVPYMNSTYYPKPVSPEAIHYLLAGIGVAIMIFSAMRYRKNKNLAFGIGFFTLHVILLLQILEAGSAFMADRFTYIAYLGLILLLGLTLQKFCRDKPAMKSLIIGGTSIALMIYAVITAGYIKAWENSDTLWSDVIEKYPEKVVVAYVNRGHYLRRNGEGERAFRDFNTAIRLKPDYVLGYLNRGNIYFDRNQFDNAKSDYLSFMQLKKDLDTSGTKQDVNAGNVYGNLGAIHARTGRFDSALFYLNVAIKSNKENPVYFNNRGQTYFELGNYDASIVDFEQSLNLKPGNADILNAVGLNHMRKGNYSQALQYFDKAITANNNQGIFYLNRAYTKFLLKDIRGSKSDVERAAQLGVKPDAAFLNSLENSTNQAN